MLANLKVKNLAVAPLLLALVFSATPAPANSAPVRMTDVASVATTLGGASSAMGIGAN